MSHLEKRRKLPANDDEDKLLNDADHSLDNSKKEIWFSTNRCNSCTILALTVICTIIFFGSYRMDLLQTLQQSSVINLRTESIIQFQQASTAIPTLTKSFTLDIEQPKVEKIEPTLSNIVSMQSNRSEVTENYQATQMSYDQIFKKRLDILSSQITDQIRLVRDIKSKGIVMAQDSEAIKATTKLQSLLRSYLKMKYGPDPYQVEMTMNFPKSSINSSFEAVILIDLAPVELVPYSVYYFLNIVNNWKGGAFHRIAGHVIQALVRSGGPSLAFQEYHPEFPHKIYTMGYAGRPGGPEFYISTVDNSFNHGPGSQGSKTEADGCFGRINDPKSIEVVKQMKKLPPGKGLGFLNDPNDHIKITKLKMIRSEL